MWLFFEVTPCVALEVVLTLEAHSAANDFAFELPLVHIKLLVLKVQVMTMLPAINVTVKK
jgi:hypothetical protein